ncbi:MAG: glycoside hydrolase 15-related protein [Steroidobacteraceae bacterium]|jgi:GH15 family glucan-1,4-alpha-glucosidase|nr:glycoside hydrolase 15-related protein [Steroidobacteraceae bacterium]
MNYGVIGNCQVAALIDEQARMVWACLPRPDGDPVFSSLLQKEGGASSTGVFAIDLVDLTRTEQEYMRNSAIIETRLYDSHGGVLRIVDFAPRFRSRGRVFRPMMFVRSVEPLAGRPTLRLRLRPTAGFGEKSPPGLNGSHHIRFQADGLYYRVTTDASLAALMEDRPVVLERPLHFIIGPDETLQESPASLTREFLGATLGYWQEWVRTLAVPADWQEAVIRSAITLKLCTYEDTGAVLAALTTSIPEAAHSTRNWDYRYCWLRDSYFVIQTLNRLGATRTMEAYLHYIDQIIATTNADTLQPLYGITGDPRAEEKIATTLSGYRGMGPVRFGNLAAEQVQHDVYGSVILAATQLFFDERLVRSGDQTLLERLYRLGKRAVASFEEPDAGPWEFRGKLQRHTFSAAISWAGCDRLARIARRVGDHIAARDWGARADFMRQEILEKAWSEERQCFTSAFGNRDIDATALLLPELGLLPATDPRFLKTLERIEEELRTGDLLFRYKHADDFGTPENAFTICAFWYVNALAAAGRLEEARERFDRLLKLRNPLGLLSEDIAPASGELWGNFPQTYSMVGIIGSALRLSRSWEEIV